MGSEGGTHTKIDIEREGGETHTHTHTYREREIVWERGREG